MFTCKYIPHSRRGIYSISNKEIIIEKCDNCKIHKTQKLNVVCLFWGYCPRQHSETSLPSHLIVGKLKRSDNPETTLITCEFF